MLKPPTDAQIETAIEWLKAHDAIDEPENGRDIEAVIAWLDDYILQRMIRAETKRAGVPIERLRKRLADQIGAKL
jgi:hypothetical protein